MSAENFIIILLIEQKKKHKSFVKCTRYSDETYKKKKNLTLKGYQ